MKGDRSYEVIYNSDGMELVQFAGAHRVPAGAVILQVQPGSPATRVVNVKNGQIWTLEPGDVITHIRTPFGNQPINSVHDFYSAIQIPGGWTGRFWYILTVVDCRDGQTRCFEAQPNQGRLGIRFNVYPPK